jgi:hypothetical protein
MARRLHSKDCDNKKLHFSLDYQRDGDQVIAFGILAFNPIFSVASLFIPFRLSPDLAIFQGLHQVEHIDVALRHRHSAAMM